MKGLVSFEGDAVTARAEGAHLPFIVTLSRIPSRLQSGPLGPEFP